MSWCKTAQRVVITSLLMITLNQNLLLCLAASQQKTEPAAPACACPPTACTCSPMSGCSHNHQGMPGQEGKKQIGICRPNSSHHQAVYPFSWGWEVPILTCYLASLVPYPSFAYLDLLPASFTLQQYLTPPDKPPQPLA